MPQRMATSQKAAMYQEAFGKPGIAPTWTSSDKDAVTSALGTSRVWVTIGHGIVNEVYWPSTGEPQIRDLGFIVATSSGWHEIKRVNQYDIVSAPGASAPKVFRHHGPGYGLDLEIVPDPSRDVLLIRYNLTGDGARLYVLLAPHMGSSGYNNTCHAGDELRATDGTFNLVLCAEHGFTRTSAGFVGRSDGWQDFNTHGEMTWSFDCASDGNVSLTGELTTGNGTLALGFAASTEGARSLAHASLADGFDLARQNYDDAWAAWASAIDARTQDPDDHLVIDSAAVIKSCEDRTYPGAIVASPSIPWGNRHNDIGGYHLIWTRDLVQCAFAFLVLGETQDACRVLSYLIASQCSKGHWAQNSHPDGRVYWKGVQLDEVGWAMLLGARCLALDLPAQRQPVIDMLAKAAAYMVAHGPVSEQDRWEENPGISPYSIAVQIAGLLAASEYLDDKDRDLARSVARYWNQRIEPWTFVEDGPLAKDHGGGGYYVRIASPQILRGSHGTIKIANRNGIERADAQIISLGFLQLVRFGLRKPDDPRIEQSLSIAEAVLGVDTPSGRGYYRYNEDGYGERPDGHAFEGHGIGRLWPLLVGERGHYAVACGQDPSKYLKAMRAMSGRAGLIPEQVWDTEPIPKRGLAPGRPTGSAMPLLWAHAEYIKLATLTDRDHPIEHLPDQALAALDDPHARPLWHWHQDGAFNSIPRGTGISIEFTQPFTLHWGAGSWGQPQDTDSQPIGLGLHAVQLGDKEMGDADAIVFTAYLHNDRAWTGHDERVERIERIEPSKQGRSRK